MSMKHTPGPWTVSTNLRNVRLGIRDAIIFGGEHHTVIATVTDIDNGGAIRIANARLIAAAPDLLEALKEALADQETMNEPYRNEAICKRMRAAIAKAEGSF